VLWTLAVIQPFQFLGLEAGEVVVVDTGHQPPMRVLGRNARPLPTNYGAICGGVSEGMLHPLTQRESEYVIERHVRRSRLHLVA
jgi:hypothetical protein